MTEKYRLDKLEFYITNVCNLTCSNCNRYNNFHFRGWAAWDDYADNLREWAKYVHVQHPVILGGEPLLNRDIVKWVRGLRELWPNSYGVQIQSNGTRIDKIPGLYNEMANGQGNWIGVSIHSQDDREELFARIRNFLQGQVTMTQDSNHPMGSAYQFDDSNHVKVHVWNNDNFGTSNISRTSKGTYTVTRSDPIRAHNNCSFRKWKNYHWINGKIYKCGPVALMPEFDQQFGLDLTNEERSVMHAYQGLAVEEWQQRGKDFLDHIDDPIEQCRFCPEVTDYAPITFENTKKSWRIELAYA
jgi:organic radical activating enzyme